MAADVQKTTTDPVAGGCRVRIPRWIVGKSIMNDSSASPEVCARVPMPTKARQYCGQNSRWINHTGCRLCDGYFGSHLADNKRWFVGSIEPNQAAVAVSKSFDQGMWELGLESALLSATRGDRCYECMPYAGVLGYLRNSGTVLQKVRGIWRRREKRSLLHKWLVIYAAL